MTFLDGILGIYTWFTRVVFYYDSAQLDQNTGKQIAWIHYDLTVEPQQNKA